jgi:DNA-binding response OmpR family regulator
MIFTPRRVIMLGSPSAEHRAAVEAAVRVAGSDLSIVRDSAKALVQTEHEHVLAVLVDTASLGAEHFCRKARSSDRLRRVPIIGLAKNPGELGFQRIFGWGADDLVALGAQEPLAERLLTLSDVSSTSERGYGQAVIAESHPERCALLGRVLTQAGYEVKYALDAGSIEFYAAQSETRLVVLGAALTASRTLIETVAQSGALPVWVVIGEPRNLPRIAHDLNGLDRVVVTSSSGSPEDILFVANELIFARTNKRSERRALHGTPVQFRESGGFGREFGFTYDVSPSGLYVRTLAACEFSHVELELRPPRKDQVVVLRGRIVRRVRFGSASIASAPAGFAVRLEGPGYDPGRAAWTTACAELLGPPSLYPEASGRAPVISVKIGGKRPLPAEARAPSSSAVPESSELPAPVEVSAPPSAELLAAEPPPDEAVEVLDDEDVAPSSAHVLAAAPTTEPPGAPSHSTLFRLAELGTFEGLSTESKIAMVVPLHLPSWATIAVNAPASSVSGRARSSRGPILLGVAGGFATVVGAVAAGFLLGLIPTGGAAAQRSSEPAALAAMVPIRAPEPVVQVAAPPIASALPPPLPPPVVATTLPPSSVAPTVAPKVDLSTILTTQGYLYVRSSVDTKVFVMGKELGTTNQPIVANCGMRFVRLGSRLGEFIEPGGTVVIKCRELTEVTREPE